MLLVFSMIIFTIPGECRWTDCPYRQLCKLTTSRGNNNHLAAEPRCFCPYYQCQGKKNPVCGYNGQTYESVCELQRAECFLRGFVGIQHFGRCEQFPPPPPPCNGVDEGDPFAEQLQTLTKVTCSPCES